MPSGSYCVSSRRHSRETHLPVYPLGGENAAQAVGSGGREGRRGTAKGERGCHFSLQCVPGRPPGRSPGWGAGVTGCGRFPFAIMSGSGPWLRVHSRCSSNAHDNGTAPWLLLPSQSCTQGSPGCRSLPPFHLLNVQLTPPACAILRVLLPPTPRTSCLPTHPASWLNLSPAWA